VARWYHSWVRPPCSTERRATKDRCALRVSVNTTDSLPSTRRPCQQRFSIKADISKSWSWNLRSVPLWPTLTFVGRHEAVRKRFALRDRPAPFYSGQCRRLSQRWGCVLARWEPRSKSLPKVALPLRCIKRSRVMIPSQDGRSLKSRIQAHKKSCDENPALLPRQAKGQSLMCRCCRSNSAMLKVAAKPLNLFVRR
jgi:hypothetical protein